MNRTINAAGGLKRHYRMPLLGASGSVKSNADKYEHDGKHDDSSESFHDYNFPI